MKKGAYLDANPSPNYKRKESSHQGQDEIQKSTSRIQKVSRGNHSLSEGRTVEGKREDCKVTRLRSIFGDNCLLRVNCKKKEDNKEEKGGKMPGLNWSILVRVKERSKRVGHGVQHAHGGGRRWVPPPRESSGFFSLDGKGDFSPWVWK